MMNSPLIGTLLAGTLACASAALAQAPRITPRGDPSVRSDTIYALAVDSSEHPGEPYIYLLDDGVIRYEADGRGSRTYRQVVQILTREGVERWGNQTFGYSGAFERLTINWVRVVRPDGGIIASRPVREEETMAPVVRDAPVYSDVKQRHVTLSGIAPGTLVDFSYTIETVRPVMPADYLTGWRVTTGRLTRRSRLLVDVPASLEPRIHEENLRFPRRTVVAGGRRVYLWAVNDVPGLEPEMFAGYPNEVETFIRVSAPITWADVGRWYAGLARGRYALTPEIETRLAELVVGARTLDDSVRAVHRWVSQDFRYVSLSLGIAGYQPHPPVEVFRAQYGDCKDKATLFIAALARLGVRAYPVLLNQGGVVNRELPSVHQFDHMIAAIERPGGYQYVDLTAELVPFGLLPPGDQGQFALIVRPDGRTEEVVLPEDPAVVNRSESRLVGELRPDGSLRGRFESLAGGTEQLDLRAALLDLTAEQRLRLGRGVANGLFEGAEGDSLEVFDGRDLAAQPRIALSIRADRATSGGGGVSILPLPLKYFANPRLVAELESRGPRRYAIDAAQVVGPHEVVEELRLVLPEGWRARLPRSVSASSVFGSYSAQYRQEGRELTVERRLAGRSGIEPKERAGDLVAWLRAIASDDARFIVLERP